MNADWMFSVVTGCQRFICSTAGAPIDVVVTTARAFVFQLPAPMIPADVFLLRAVLVDLAAGFGISYHAQLRDRCRQHPCTLQALSEIGIHWRARDRDPRETFCDWIRLYCQEVLETHPERLARRVATIVEANFQRRLGLRSLSRLVGASPSSIHREFRREFGMSPRQFHTLTRLRMAEKIMSESPATKSEAVALSVGWRSKTGFYRALKGVHGCTPKEWKAH